MGTSARLVLPLPSRSSPAGFQKLVAAKKTGPGLRTSPPRLTRDTAGTGHGPRAERRTGHLRPSGAAPDAR